MEIRVTVYGSTFPVVIRWFDRDSGKLVREEQADDRRPGRAGSGPPGASRLRSGETRRIFALSTPRASRTGRAAASPAPIVSTTT